MSNPSRPRIQVMSDLHLEFDQSYDTFTFAQTAPYLALLGDIGRTVDEGYVTFLESQLQRYEKVFLLLGNHEAYHSDNDTSRARIQAFSQSWEERRRNSMTGTAGNFVFLDQTRFDLTDDLTILGCTLHSRLYHDQLEVILQRLNDFKLVKKWSPDLYSAAHAEDLAWLNLTCAQIAKDEPERRVVVLTHHAPTIKGTCAPMYEGSNVSSAFATELTSEPCWKSKNVFLWAFGHTHFCCDFMRDGVRVYSNARGRGSGSKSFQSEAYLEL
ncbi:hypothetical protein JAAARDRAFT_41697 [Jaapia argillacea MUCL 33604]|uniref:Calcineurin-like phosphoesterase domain-containing protein n=1 Tax=Jaapia argillacea MUCL 33604 TaxID=933084 RepID=A0A067P7P5_9AGAM|nr:hypothetical protein JAAARDRAFT_41697 [Jaapia argillacea MUCL 33604]